MVGNRQRLSRSHMRIGVLVCASVLLHALPFGLLLNPVDKGAALTESREGHSQHVALKPTTGDYSAVTDRTTGGGHPKYVRGRTQYHREAIVRQGATLRRGSTFFRNYVPHRLRRILAPVSNSESDSLS